MIKVRVTCEKCGHLNIVELAGAKSDAQPQVRRPAPVAEPLGDPPLRYSRKAKLPVAEPLD